MTRLREMSLEAQRSYVESLGIPIDKYIKDGMVTDEGRRALAEIAGRYKEPIRTHFLELAKCNGSRLLINGLTKDDLEKIAGYESEQRQKS